MPIVLRIVLNAIRPKALVLTECELWPNMIRLTARRGVPVILVNGRISERSGAGYRRLRWFFGPVLRAMRTLMVQTPADERRLLAAGAPADRLQVTGSAKYDVARSEVRGLDATWRMLEGCGIGKDDAILLGGSTWPGEEAALLAAFRELRGLVPGLKLVLVPRHAERGAEVEGELRAAGVRHVRRSTMRAGAAPEEGTEVLLVDTTGELRNLYACATVVFVGKSLTNHGGQNIIEPAFFAKPIVVGPNMENFPEIIDDFLAAQAIVQVRDAAGLHGALRSLLTDAASREALGRRAGALVESKCGVIDRGVREILAAIG
jgi:3-deoxy-D-manno-octulosonic-acid transferase